MTVIVAVVISLPHCLCSIFERICCDPFNEFWTKVTDFAQRIFVVPTPPPGSLRIVSACWQWWWCCWCCVLLTSTARAWRACHPQRFSMYGEHTWTLNPYHPCAPHGSEFQPTHALQQPPPHSPPPLPSPSVGSSELDIRLHYPFLCLSPENVLKVIAAILAEKRIIFSSSHYTLLTFIIEVGQLNRS